MLTTVSYNKLKKEEKKDYIKFIEDYNLPQFNEKLFSEIEKQNVSYIISLVSIAFSLFSLINYYLKYNYFYQFSLVIMFFSLICFVSPTCILSSLNLIDYAKSLIRDYVKTDLSKILTKKNCVIITVAVSLFLTFFFKSIFEDSRTYVMLSIWFLLSGIGFDYFKDYTQIRNPRWIIILPSILALAIALIIEFIFVTLSIFQYIQHWTLFASIYILLLKYQQDIIKDEK